VKKQPASDLEALRDDLRQIYAGEPWHGSSITDVLEGVDAEIAGRRTIANAHTIWELVLHLAVWTWEVASRVRGGNPRSPPEDWPRQNPDGGEAAWRAALADLASAQKNIERAVDDLEPADLVRWIDDKRDPAVQTGTTVGTLLRGLLQHYAYHQGQIAILKRAANPDIGCQAPLARLPVAS
jgi:uncharacterized damage-inducible protein DinB